MTSATIALCGLSLIVGYILGYESAWCRAQREARALVRIAQRWAEKVTKP